MDACDECGFVYAQVGAETLVDRLREFGPRYAAALRAIGEPRRRPAPEVWSPLEYVCHVRDVFQAQRERLELAIRTDEPEFTPMGREELVVTRAYNQQDPEVALRELAAVAEELAVVLAGPVDLDRTGVYNWPHREVRTLLWLGRHTVHEGEHHLLDVRRAQLR